jgi:hypothetical protein
VSVASLCGPTCGAPLFVHVLGATLLFGATLAVTTLAVASRRFVEQGALLRRLAFTITLVGVWPAYIVMRVGAQWVLSHEGLDNDNSPGWVGVGFAVSDFGIVILLALTLLGWLGLRRARAGTWFAVLAALYLVALGVAWFAMSAKPGS